MSNMYWGPNVTDETFKRILKEEGQGADYRFDGFDEQFHVDVSEEDFARLSKRFWAGSEAVRELKSCFSQPCLVVNNQLSNPDTGSVFPDIAGDRAIFFHGGKK